MVDSFTRRTVLILLFFIFYEGKCWSYQLPARLQRNCCLILYSGFKFDKKNLRPCHWCLGTHYLRIPVKLFNFSAILCKKIFIEVNLLCSFWANRKVYSNIEVSILGQYVKENFDTKCLKGGIIFVPFIHTFEFLLPFCQFLNFI